MMETAESASLLNRATKMLSTMLYRDWISMEIIGGTAILIRSGNMLPVPRVSYSGS